jgi:hypothetical protein
MSTLVGLATLPVVGLILLVVGAAIQLRNRSPYSRTTMDQDARKRFGLGAWIAAAGSLCILLAQLARIWR